MGIRTFKEFRRYRAYLKELERAEFIEVRFIRNETEDKVPVETTEPVERSLLPDHLGNKIDIYI